MSAKNKRGKTGFAKLTSHLNEILIWLNSNGLAELRPSERKKVRDMVKDISTRMSSVKCFNCGEIVRYWDLESHKQQCKKGKNQKSSISFNDLLGKEQDLNEEERRLDGSRDYYNNFRENGRFGSHPRFDDGGDESEP